MAKDTHRSFAVFILIVFLVKALAALLDPVPKFFFGDSYSYLYTAAEGWIPPDRSFAYGYFIRLTTLPGESLTPLMAVQWLASASVAVLLGYMLRRTFKVRPGVAYLFGILCALEPIQLLYERYVMTETLSLFVLVLYLMTTLGYLEAPRLRTLVLMQILGTALITLRISFLPIVMVNAVLVPLLGHRAEGQWRTDAHGPPRRLFVTGLHLLISLVATYSLHTGYKHLFSTLSGNPPVYNASRGYFLLATWAPVVEPEDFPHPELRARIFDHLPYDLKDRALRNDQLFSDGALIDRIRNALPDPEGDRAASATAINALRRDPLGILVLAFQTLGDFFDVRLLGEKIMNDLALDQAYEYERLVEHLGARYGLSEAEPQPFTLTKSYYQNAIPWYWFLLFSPALWAFAFFVARRGVRRHAFVLFIASLGTITVATALSVQPIVRYLHPVSWLALCALGILCDRAFRPSLQR
jgi:hypothetical protein